MLQVPRELSCGHRVCLQCTHKITSSTQNNTNTNNNNNLQQMLRCPQCHTLTKVHDVQEPVMNQTNAGKHPPYIQSSLSNYIFHLFLLAGQIQICGYCEEAPATRVCLNCEKPGMHLHFLKYHSFHSFHSFLSFFFSSLFFSSLFFSFLSFLQFYFILLVCLCRDITAVHGLLEGDT